MNEKTNQVEEIVNLEAGKIQDEGLVWSDDLMNDMADYYC